MLLYDEYDAMCADAIAKYGTNTVVLMEVGGFYELYGVDNHEEKSGARMYEFCDAMNIVVSRKNKSIVENSRSNPLFAGFPSSHLNKYCELLAVRASYNVVVVNQFGTPPKKLTRRVVRVVTPSTCVEQLQDHRESNLMTVYVEAIDAKRYAVGITVLDLSTGVVRCEEFECEEHRFSGDVSARMIAFEPKELLFMRAQNTELEWSTKHIDHSSKWSKDLLKPSFHSKILREAYPECGMLDPIEFVCMERAHVARVGFVYTLHYLSSLDDSHHARLTKPITRFDRNGSEARLTSDSARQLQLVDDAGEECLLKIVDTCVTSMGRRHMRQTLLNPSACAREITERHSRVERLLNDPELLLTLRTKLRGVHDFVRTIRRATIQPHDMVNMCAALRASVEVRSLYENRAPPSEELMITWLEERFDMTLASKYTLQTVETCFIKRAFAPELNERAERLEEIAAAFRRRELRDDLKTLGAKLVYTEKDGFQMHVRASNSTNVPDGYTKTPSSKKTHLNVLTPELRELNQEYMHSKRELIDASVRTYVEQMREWRAAFAADVDALANFVQHVDVCAANAHNAVELGLVRPVVLHEETRARMNIEGLRHPIVERVSTNSRYVPNDALFDDQGRGSLVYGTNAAGKSSYMKSVGIAVVMAQAGMYVSARAMTLAPYRAIYTRIVSNDNIYKGKSTFVNEMYELRTILSDADEFSLVLGDELCSGTESTSAVSIVAAGITALLSRGANFVFASHFHAVASFPDIANDPRLRICHLSVVYDERLRTLVYDRVIRDGPGGTLYGLEVCKSLDMGKAFLAESYRFREMLMGREVGTRTSAYNSQVYVRSKCEVCGACADEVHHIRYQSESNSNNRIEEFHMNSRFNLVPLCKPCHSKVHRNELAIHGYVDTVDGVRLKSV
jgi:DNA mismatch repair protein MutS